MPRAQPLAEAHERLQALRTRIDRSLERTLRRAAVRIGAVDARLHSLSPLAVSSTAATRWFSHRRRTANQALNNNAAALEERVYERTKELEEALAELEKSKRAIESYAAQVANDLREKEVLLREVHHRVKNNLQVMQSLMKMRARTVASPEAREAIESAIQRVHVIATVHEKLYQMPNISSLSLSEYLREVVEGAVNSGSESAYQIEVKIEADASLIAMDTAVPLGLLVNELVLNSLKHGFKDHMGGRIAVSITGDAGQRRLVIEDNGCGLPPGFDAEKSNSMGLKLAVSLAGRLGGELRFSSSPGCRVEAVLTRL